MTTRRTPAELFAEGQKGFPRWDDDGPEADAKRDRATASITEAAEAGYLPAIEFLAGGGSPEGFAWALHLAKLGDVRDLSTVMTNGDHPVEKARAVLEAARAGEPWAQHTIGMIYGKGLQAHDTGEYVVTRENAWGFLPAATDPDAESRRWSGLAADAGFAPAALSLVFDLRYEEPAAALRRLRTIPPDAPLLPVQQKQVKKLLADLLEETEAPLEEQVAAYTTLADTGDGDALAWLAKQHAGGEGPPKDLAKARALYERAAAAGSVDGFRELGRCFEEGLGGPVDLARARELYERAAELGNDSFARDRLAERFGLDFYRRGPDER